MMREFAMVASFGFLLAACGSHDQASSTGTSAAVQSAKSAPSSAPTSPAPTTAEASSAAPSSSAAGAGSAPPDGKYEHVTVDGVTVPMIEVMDHGNVVLVDTDGKKPRTWEEQYKRKGNIPLGSYDIHKTAKDGKFDGAAIDKEGLWVIDAKGNLTRH
jgi:hypothetical protein